MEITGKTRLTGLIGSPVAHSISPQMHNEAFRLLGLDYVYLAFDLGHSSLRQAVEGLREIGCRGFNVTMPYKVPILEFMDELTPAARIAGACNTVIIKDGRMTGHTTDGVGFMQSVTDAGHNIFRKKMTILGAGGAATAIITQAALDGVRRIDIFRRSRPEAFSATEAFARKVQQETGCPVRVFDIADTSEYCIESVPRKITAIMMTESFLALAKHWVDMGCIAKPEQVAHFFIRTFRKNK